MTEQSINQSIPWRVLGDRADTREMFVPRLVLPPPPTEEQRAAWAEEAAKREAEHRAATQAAIAGHVTLAERHADAPILSTLLTEHAPVVVKYGDRVYLECHGCPDYYDSEHDMTEHAEWPCPTWTTIAEQSEGAA